MDALPEIRGPQSPSEPLRRVAACDRSGAHAGLAASAGAALPSILHAFGVPWTGTGSRSRRGQDQRSP